MTEIWHEHAIDETHIGNYEIVGDVVLCSECGKRVVVAYGESYDPETGWEDDWWYYVEIQ